MSKNLIKNFKINNLKFKKNLITDTKVSFYNIDVEENQYYGDFA
jgi:hypothetical protein